MSKYISKYVVCPFYRRNDTNRICCDGVDRTNTINLVFEHKEEVLKYQREYCNDILAHNDCWICRMHNEKCDEEESNE